MAGRLDDERVDEGHLPPAVVRIVVDDLFAGDDLRGRPTNSRKITAGQASNVSQICRCLPLLLPKFPAKRNMRLTPYLSASLLGSSSGFPSVPLSTLWRFS